MVELNLVLDFALVGILAWRNNLYNNAIVEVEKAYVNDNFGCFNRAGAIALGNKFIKREQRRVKSGDLVMVAIDIAGMGQKNAEIGEIAVNEAIAKSLAEIKKFREVEFISQLNSGDEFCFVCDAGDAIGLIERMNRTFISHGFNEGIYAATVTICGDYVSTANRGMQEVYKIKMSKKGYN